MFWSRYLRLEPEKTRARQSQVTKQDRLRWQRAATLKQPLTAGEWKRVGAIFVFFLFTILFWAAYEQKGASLNLFAKDLVRTEVFGMRFPSSWSAVVHAAFRDYAGADFFHALGETRKAPAIESGQVYVRTAVHRPRLLPAGARRVDDGLWEDQSALAGWSLLSRGGR